MKSTPRLIAFYLPQYHPIKENDEWWGKGFTEWTNVAKAKPLFPNHYQPHIPSDLGFYDLRVPETRTHQADLAKQHGVESFCYYHYWFAGKELLERPFKEVLQTGEPDFGFCICWANQTWSGIWHGCPDRILIEQTYPGEEDHRKHFDSLLPAFLDKRYTRIDGMPIFIIFRPQEIPDSRKTTDLWRKMAVDAGLKGLYFIGIHENPYWNPQDHGYDASITPKLPPRNRPWISRRQPIKWLKQKYEESRGIPKIYEYKNIYPELLVNSDINRNFINYPCIIPNWDNTPRSGAYGMVFHESSPSLFRLHFKEALKLTQNAANDNRLIFIKAWNEWAEGNYLEPDMRFGLEYLEVIRDELSEIQRFQYQLITLFDP